jgi:site-specific DNA recombinase
MREIEDDTVFNKVFRQYFASLSKDASDEIAELASAEAGLPRHVRVQVRSIPFADAMSMVERWPDKGRRAWGITLKETLDTSTAHGRFFVNLMGSLNELERDRTAERNSATTLSRAERGLWNGGMLLGYDLGEKKGSLVVNEREAEIVRFAFETYLQTGSILKTVTIVNDRGFRTKGYLSQRGKIHPPKRFWYTSMRWLLCNPAYIGTKEINKKKRNLDQSKLPENQRYRIVDANWPPIVSKETFEKVQLLLGENLRSGHNRADTKKHVYLLQGLVTCGKCSGHMEGRSGTLPFSTAFTSPRSRARR